MHLRNPLHTFTGPNSAYFSRSWFCILSKVLILHTFPGPDSGYFPRSWFWILSQVLILHNFPGPHSGYFPRSSFWILSKVLILDTFPGPGERTPSLRFVVSLPTQAESTPPVCRHISWQLKFQFPFCKISKYGFCFLLRKSNVSDVFSYALYVPYPHLVVIKSLTNR